MKLTGQQPVSQALKLMDSRSGSTRSLEVAQAALLARYAPGTHVRRVRWSQGETQVLELGSGPALLLVHGGMASGFYWAPILRALAENRRVLVVDLPGHGLADSFDYTDVHPLAHAATFLGEILNALGLPSVDIVANSLG
ncbi:MAG: alpha/beta fold hydrolase, partial [Nitrososphaerota archaeon]